MYIYSKLKDFQQFTKLSLFSKKRVNSIGTKLLIRVLAVSSLFVILQTLVQLNNDYKLGLSEIDRRFNQLSLSYRGGLARSIWEVNNTQIESIIEGMLQIPDVVKVTVTESSGNADAEEPILAEVGIMPESGFLQRNLPVTIQSGGVDKKIGSLIIAISLDALYEDLYGTVIFILLFQVVKTFLMSAFILAIFHYLVTRHLVVMAKFSSDTNPNNLGEMLLLDRKSLGDEDEITAMSDALNDTKRNLKKLVQSNEQSVQMHVELAQKEEKEQAHQQFKQQIEAKNEKLADSNNELASTINELKSTQDQLVNSEKMAALGGMVQGVAHELNTPIGLSITGASHIKSDTDRIISLLAGNKMKKSDLDDYLDSTKNLSKSINIGLDKAANLIKSFKLVSVEQHEELKQDFDVRHNLEDILYSIRPSIREKKDIQIYNNIVENIEICSFPGVFYQIYTNLINNAMLHAFEFLDEGEITIFGEYQDQHLLMSVKDNGCGMNEETIKKVFDPFFTTKRANGGTGLGMNIIYNLVNDKLHGSIRVESKEGEGTIFYFKIPNLI